MKNKSEEELKRIEERLLKELRSVQVLLNRPKFTIEELGSFVGRYFKEAKSIWFIKAIYEDTLDIEYINLYDEFIERDTICFTNSDIFPADKPYSFSYNERNFLESSREVYNKAESILSLYENIQNKANKELQELVENLKSII
jgi:hypothetical protein